MGRVTIVMGTCEGDSMLLFFSQRDVCRRYSESTARDYLPSRQRNEQRIQVHLLIDLGSFDDRAWINEHEPMNGTEKKEEDQMFPRLLSHPTLWRLNEESQN